MLRSFRASLPLIFMIMTAGSDGQQGWGVTYSPSYVCALKGSTVKIFCVLNYPSNHNLDRVFWTKSVTDGELPELCSDPEKTGRIQCVSEYKDTSSMTLTGVTEADKHIYYCTSTTNVEAVKWTGAQLDVTDLQVETQQTVKEGDSVTLRCKSSCSLTEETTFIWSRDTKTVNKGIATLNQLHLWSVVLSDAGNYRCAVRGKAGETLLISPPVYIYVQLVDGLQDQGVNYSPSYVCALNGSTVKISCTYSTTYSGHQLIPAFWTKTTVSVGEPQNLCLDPDRRGGIDCYTDDEDTSSMTLTGVTEADKHVYYCSITNKPNKRRTVLPGALLDVTGLQVETQQTVKEGDSVTLRCKTSCSLTEETTFIWYRNTETVNKGIATLNQLHLESVSRSDAGDYSCAGRGKAGETPLNSPPVYLKVGYPPESVSVSISESAETVSGDSVTLSCSSDSNPPALSFSWFKEDQSSAVGSGQSFSALQSGRYYCEAYNPHGSQRSASVSVTVKGVQRAALLTLTGIVAGCGGLTFIIIIFIIVFISRKWRRAGGTEDVKQKQITDSSDETYTALDPASRRSDDVYSTIPSVHSRAPDETYTALELQSRSSEYETLHVAGASADPH